MIGSMAANRRRGAGGPIIANGSFDNGTSPWTAASGTSLSVAAGKLRVDVGSAYGYCTTLVALTVGQAYRLTLDVDPGTAGPIGVKGGSGALGVGTFNATVSSTQTGHVVDFTANIANMTVTLQSLAGLAGRYFEIDNIGITAV